MPYRRPALAPVAAALAALALLLPAPLIGAAQSATPATGTDAPVSVVAAGLTNPRGFAWDDAGALFVASAGRSGATAGVVAIEEGCPTPLVEGLPSYQIVFGAPTGVADVAFIDGARHFLLAGGNIDGGGMANGLYRLDDAGGAELVADVSAFIRDNPVAEVPYDGDTDGQPHAMLPVGDELWVTEGNSNQLLRIGPDGVVSRVADLSAGHPIPTGIAPAPDGGAYVGFFTLYPYRDGAAKVVRVAPDGTVADAWTGLTLVIALAVGPDGALYALEMATGIEPNDPNAVGRTTGRVVRQTGPDSAAEVVTGLDLPSAMRFGPDGALYVATPTFGANEGEGRILRIEVDPTAGEPVAVPPDLAAGVACA